MSSDFDSLSEAEYYRFSNMSLKAFWLFSANHFQFRMGTLDEGDFREVRSVLRYWLSRPGFRAWWAKLGRDSVAPAFREFVEAELAEMDVAGAD